MKKYKITFSLFGKKHKVSFKASNREAAAKKLKLYIKSQVVIDNLECVDNGIDYQFDSIMDIFNLKKR